MLIFRTKNIELVRGAYYVINCELAQKTFTVKILEIMGGLVKVKIVEGKALFEHAERIIGDSFYLKKKLCSFEKVGEAL